MESNDSENRVGTYVSSAVISLKEEFIKELLKQPSAQDLKTWFGGDKWYSVCQRCRSKSIPCSPLPLTVVSCAECIRDGVALKCSRFIEERESRVRRVLNIDADTFRSFFRSCFPIQMPSSNRNTPTSSSSQYHAVPHLTPTCTPPNEPLLISSERPFTPSNSLGNQSDRIIPRFLVINESSTPSMDNSGPGADVRVPGFGVDGSIHTIQQEPNLSYSSAIRPFDSNSGGSAVVGDKTTETARQAQTESATASTSSKHHRPTSSSDTNDLGASSESKHPFVPEAQSDQSQKELHVQIEELEGQLEEVKVNLSDVESKLKDEIARTTELGQQLEANRRETGDLRRHNARLEEKIKGREEEWNKRAAKMVELEAKVRKGEYELHVARQHEEKLEEMDKAKIELKAKIFELLTTMGKAKVESDAKVVELQTTMMESRKKLEEDYSAAVAKHLSEMEKWSVEKKTLELIIKQQQKTIKKVQGQQYENGISQEEQESSGEVESSRQHDYEVQKTYQDTVMQMNKSMDELKQQIEQLRLSQNDWREKAEARNVELQHVRKLLDGQTKDMNKMEATLAAERRGKRKATEELREKSREQEKQINIDLALIHSNMERLVQQFRSIRTALADKQASDEAVLDTCDHLGWQLVAIADSIADGLKNKSDPNSSKSDAVRTSAIIPITTTTHSPRPMAPLTSSSPTVVQPTAHQSTSPNAERVISKPPATPTSPSQTPTRQRRQTARKTLGNHPPLSSERSSSSTLRPNAELEISDSEEERRSTPALNSSPRKQTARKSVGLRPPLPSERNSSISSPSGRNQRNVSSSDSEGHSTPARKSTPSVWGSSIPIPSSERRRRTAQTARKSLGPRPPLPPEPLISEGSKQEAGSSEDRRGTSVLDSTLSLQGPSTSVPDRDTEGSYPSKQTARKSVGGSPYPAFVRKSPILKRHDQPLHFSDLGVKPLGARSCSPTSSVQGTFTSPAAAQLKLRIQTARKRLSGRPFKLPPLFGRSSSDLRVSYDEELRTGPKVKRGTSLNRREEFGSPDGESAPGKRIPQVDDEDEELWTRPRKKQRR